MPGNERWLPWHVAFFGIFLGLATPRFQLRTVWIVVFRAAMVPEFDGPVFDGVVLADFLNLGGRDPSSALTGFDAVCRLSTCAPSSVLRFRLGSVALRAPSASSGLPFSS